MSAAEESREVLQLVFVGHVDHGKSTLVGRLLEETGTIAPERIELVRRICAERNMPFELAFLLDAFEEEQSQGVTIDVAQIQFSTAGRTYVILDAPGHREFLKNMVSGAARADAAILLIDAAEGIQEQTRRHGAVLRLLGISQVIVVVNKMDLVDHSLAVFDRIRTEFGAFLARLDLEALAFLPVSARDGENVTTRSPRLAGFDGPTFLESLALLRPTVAKTGPLRFSVQDVYKFDERRIVAGRIESGSLAAGERLLFLPSNKTTTIRAIASWPEAAIDAAGPGESIGLILEDPLYVERGEVACHEAAPPYMNDIIEARIFWLGRHPLAPGREFRLKLAAQETLFTVERIEKVIDSSTLETLVERHDRVESHEVAEVVLKTARPLLFDNFTDVVETGRFVVVDDGVISGGGTIRMDRYPDRRREIFHEVKSKNIGRVEGEVSRARRAERNRHKGAIVWLTGLSGAGKSTIAVELERLLFEANAGAYLLDGDNIRHGLNSDLGFSADDRAENIRRIAEVARLFADAGLVAITAFISPYRSGRAEARRIAGELDFIEVWVRCPLEVCRQRDPKGLYEKAIKGEIAEFTGVSSPYEAPEQPDLVLETDAATVEECASAVLDLLKRRVFQ